MHVNKLQLPNFDRSLKIVCALKQLRKRINMVPASTSFKHGLPPFPNSNFINLKFKLKFKILTSKRILPLGVHSETYNENKRKLYTKIITINRQLNSNNQLVMKLTQIENKS